MMKRTIFCLTFLLSILSLSSLQASILDENEVVDVSSHYGHQVRVKKVEVSYRSLGRGKGMDVYADVVYSNSCFVPDSENIHVMRSNDLSSQTLELFLLNTEAYRSCPTHYDPVVVRYKVAEGAVPPACGLYQGAMVNGVGSI